MQGEIHMQGLSLILHHFNEGVVTEFTAASHDSC